MPELQIVIWAAAAGTCWAAAGLVLGRAVPAAAVTSAVRALLPRPADMAAIRRLLAVELQRAGWRESPERVAALAVVVAGGLSALGLSTAVVLAPATATALALAGALTGAGAVAFAIRSSAARRRTRLTRELAPLLELFVLELGGGGSPLSALGSVTLQLEGELAMELRRLLIGSQVSGSASFELRLRQCGDRLQVPALGSLATVLTANRDHGIGVTQGVRALAADLRRHQRRELIAHSRRALNHVLFPAAIGVLLPFLAILLFPAVTALQGNLR